MAIPELLDTSGRLTDCIYFGDPISASVGSGFVATTRTINTTLPLTGGGDLSANRTLAINSFAGSVAGAVPASTGGVVTFLRADGAWATPPTFGAAAAGYAPASGGGAINYLRADGTWAAPAGSTISGLTAGFMPIADSATSIIDGPIEQITDGLRFYSSYAAGPIFRSLRMTNDWNTCTLEPFNFDPPTLFATSLKLTGQLGLSSIELVGQSVIVTGGITFPAGEITVANGANNDVDVTAGGYSQYVRMIGPTLPFSIGGIGFGGLGGGDGQFVTLFNTTDQPWTIKNEDGASFAANRITTNTDNDVVLAANTSVATFVYSTDDSRWTLVSTSPVAQFPRTINYVPFENADHNLADSSLYHDGASQQFGFSTASPTATVDINGTISVRRYAQLLAAGLNSDIPAPTTSFMRVSGPASAFSVGGIATVASEDGKKLTIYNSTSQAMTIVNEDASSTAAYRINTLTGANLVFPARQSVVHLTYNSAASRWIVDEANPVTAGGATTQIQYNSAGALAGSANLTATFPVTGAAITLGTDTSISKKATRSIELGIPNSAPSAYVIAGNSSIGGTDSNKVGGKLSIGGGAGTGTGGGGDTALITAFPTTFGNTQNTHVDRLIYGARPKAMVNASPVSVATIKVSSESYAGGTLWASVCATDGTDMQVRRMRVEWGAVNKANVITIVLGTPEEVDCTPVGTLTATITAVDNSDDTFDFQITPTSSLTTTVFEAWSSIEHDGRGTVTMI